MLSENLEDCGHDQFQGTMPAFIWRD